MTMSYMLPTTINVALKKASNVLQANFCRSSNKIHEGCVHLVHKQVDRVDGFPLLVPEHELPELLPLTTNVSPGFVSFLITRATQ